MHSQNHTNWFVCESESTDSMTRWSGCSDCSLMEKKIISEKLYFSLFTQSYDFRILVIWYSYGAFESFLKLESSRSHFSLVHWKELPVQNSYFNFQLTKESQMGLEQHEDEQIKDLSFLCEIILKQFSSQMLKLAVSAHLPFPEIVGLNIISFSSRGNCCWEQFVCFAMKCYTKLEFLWTSFVTGEQ